jgi:hypothetical protein
MKLHPSYAWARVVIGSALAVGMLLFPSPSSGQVAGQVPSPKQPPNIAPPRQGTADRLHAAPAVARGPGQRAEGRRLNARRGGGQGDHRRERPGGQSAGDHRSGGGPAQLLQGGFDLRLVSWGDGSSVPKTRNKLVVIGIDHKGLLHIRIFDAGGKRVMDTDETELSSAHAVEILTLKQQLSGLSPPQELTGARKARVMRKVILLALQTYQDPQPRLHQAQPRQLPKRSRAIRSRSGRAAGSSPNPGRSTEQEAR